MTFFAIFKSLKRKFDVIFFPVDSARKLGCKVGENTILDNINLGSEPYLVEIGNNCHITYNVSFITHDGATWVIKRKYDFKGTNYGKIIIRDNVFIGNHSIILPNVEIGPNCIIGAGSVVTKNIPPDSVFAGNPAKFICTIEEYYQKCVINKGNLQNSKYWEDYQEFERDGKISKQQILTNFFK
jgi:acetyltransferase-like isoleucine patch superfamily enzyme